ncbi:hypothetical protein [Microvirga aerilata]|uniref:hypothetical protein n=1 Tax=Microvirga aerilata TaxID=670292 RepID=UPI001FE77E71|nr:hypothetical protein [Microvirga aerilata]
MGIARIEEHYVHIIEAGDVDLVPMQHVPDGVADETGTDPAVREAEALHMEKKRMQACMRFQKLSDARDIAEGKGSGIHAAFL